MGLEEMKRGSLRRGRLLGIALLVVGLAIALASCGGGGSSSSSSSSSTVEEASTGEETSSGEEAGGGASAEVEAAEEVVEEAKAEPTEIGVTEPLKSKPAPGKTIVWLNCDFEQCQQTGEAMEEAVKPLGYTLKKVAYKSAEPATLIAAFKQALQYNPVGVALSGVNSAAWPSVIPEYEKAGVPIVEGLAGPQETNKALVANLWNEKDLEKDAVILANWMTVESNGEGSAVVLGVPEFPILSGFADAFETALGEACSGCSATSTNATIAQIGSPTESNGLLVSAAQKSADSEFVITCDGALSPGLPAALSGAGLEGKKVAGALGTENSQAEIIAGKASAFTGQNVGYYGWALVDSILRADQGMEIPDGDGGMPHQLLTEENVGTPSPSNIGPKEYEGQFEDLWKLG